MNEIYKAIWTPSTLLIIKISNVHQIEDESVPLQARIVTLEDEATNSFTERSFLKSDDPLYERIAYALR